MSQPSQPCGCRIASHYDPSIHTHRSPEIQWCKLHRQAEAMREALKRLIAFAALAANIPVKECISGAIGEAKQVLAQVEGTG